ncbi:ALP1-like protein isoform X1 [Tanacetum coccineum]
MDFKPQKENRPVPKKPNASSSGNKKKGVEPTIENAFLVLPGFNNDVNILHQSPVLNDLKVRKAPEIPFVANDVTYKWGYYLTDGIYPEKCLVLTKLIRSQGFKCCKRIDISKRHKAAKEKMWTMSDWRDK